MPARLASETIPHHRTHYYLTTKYWPCPRYGAWRFYWCGLVGVSSLVLHCEWMLGVYNVPYTYTSVMHANACQFTTYYMQALLSNLSYVCIPICKLNSYIVRVLAVTAKQNSTDYNCWLLFCDTQLASHNVYYSHRIYLFSPTIMEYSFCAVVPASLPTPMAATYNTCNYIGFN